MVRTLRGVATQIGVAAAIFFGAASALAASDPIITVGISTVGIYDNYNYSGPVTTANPDGSFSLDHQPGYGTDFNCDWSITVNPDPSISGSFNLKNLSGSAQTFVLTVTLPTSILGPTKMGGSFGDVSFSDTGGANPSGPAGPPDSKVTLMTLAGTPFYRALIDGLGVQDMGSFSLTASSGPGASGTISQQVFGAPIPSAPGPNGVSSSIGIRVTFNLTAGDSTNIPVFFRVEAPEPASLALVGLGLAALAIARKRA